KQGVSTDGATIYVTHFPCLNCTKSIIQAGIKTIYYAGDYHNHHYAIKLLNQSGIEYKKIPFNQEHVAQYLINKYQLIYYSFAYLVGILWLHVKPLSILISGIIVFLVFRKSLNWCQVLIISILPLISYTMHQNDLENEKKARALYLEQNLHIKTQFVTKPLLEGKKLSGKAKIGNKVYHYY